MERGSRGRTARVYTNRTCNQNCGFCDRRSPQDRPGFVATRAVLKRIQDAEGTCVVLTGGEPTLRYDLPRLVAAASGRGVRVELETNATLIDEGRAAALARAGLDLARVHLPGWGDACDAITRDPGGFERTLAGINALRTAGLPVEVASPVVRANAQTLAGLPSRLASLDVGSLVLGVPVDAPSRRALLPLPEAAAVVERVEISARRAGVTVRLDAHTSLPPCLFSRPARVAHLFSLTPGGRRREGYTQVAPCARCAVNDRCPGVPDGSPAAVALALRPVTADRVRRRLSLISTVDEQVDRELFQDEIQRRPGAAPRLARTVRINFRCNQVCRFCFVSTHLPTAPEARVRDAITEAARQGGCVALSGGEPTLHPQLVDFVALADRAGASLVELQTNAIRLDDAALVAALKRAGLGLVYISLHSHRAEVSDAITGAPGTFTRTVAGVDEVCRQGLRVRLSYVFCQANITDFPGYVSWVAARWPGVEIGVSFVAASTDLVPRTAELVPRYTDALPHLARGMTLASELGVRLSGFESMCGLPLCLVPDGLAPFLDLAHAPDDYDGGEVVSTPACAECDLRGRCFGLRRGYAALHGTDELRPFKR